ncbi:ferredoxin reductase [Hoyosella rhizosphaerae]|uniref:NADPH oxidoreductase n=1 Tax=Hoyosella rhizosphaerae TaxID=1755582 RepID=A0A916XDR7_9ACTN|nr:ferredoxin reductase [Hoyosella rhizosphaerae]MBN4925986.1 ferredoxin reductase [Hoyosella rhizosphaerae]GGC66434.1 NADPH oxidoreductase [Hoyosella rhizosphaerae]
MKLWKWLEKPVEDIPNAGSRQLDKARAAFTRLTTPLIPDDYLHLINPLWSARELRGRIVDVKRETADSATVVIKPGWGFNYRYRAGQFVGIGLHIDGRWHWRSYSLTSPPTQSRGKISIAVKAMPEGFLSTHLVGGVKEGTIIRLAAPQGDFVLPDPPPSKLLFITAGSGITPVIGMLRTLVHRGVDPDVVHVHSARTAGDVMFAAELAGYEEQRNYRLHLQLTDEQGIFGAEMLEGVVADWRSREAWVCGPPGMLEAMENHFSAAGLREHMHIERFTIDRTEYAGEGGTVSFARSGKSIQVDGATTLLEAGEQVGVRMPFGCRMGICHTCVAGLGSGFVRDLRSGREAGAGERVKTCISVAAGDCSLEL